MMPAVRRPTLLVLAALVVAASAGLGVAAWSLTRDSAAPLPQISVYSRGETVRVGPFLYCNVLNLDDCAQAGEQGALAVDAGSPVQLSIPSAISDAPWRLLKVYEDERDSTTTLFRPGTRLAVTIPTTDPQRGRLVGVAVQLMTLVRDENDEVFDLPHGEWSVRLQWDRVPPAPKNPAPKN